MIAYCENKGFLGYFLFNYARFFQVTLFLQRALKEIISATETGCIIILSVCLLFKYAVR